jgi:carbonic anhydrase
VNFRSGNVDNHNVTRRCLISGLALHGTLFLRRGSAGPAKHSAASPAAETVLQELKQGNLRFATDHPRHPHGKSDWVRKTSREGQHPTAAVLCCSDSRVPPEILFDQGIGDLFTIRVAGNAGNEDEIASIEYAVEHLHVPVCVVLGHTSCGAVTAVVTGEKLPIEIQHLVAHISEAFEGVKTRQPGLDEKGLVEATMEANVFQAMHDLVSHGPIIREHMHAGRLKLVGAIYHIDTGKVSWLGPHPQERQLVSQAG